MSGLLPSGFVAVLTQGFALGWDMAAPLALNKGEGISRSPFDFVQGQGYEFVEGVEESGRA